jgi:hypothetical protein
MPGAGRRPKLLKAVDTLAAILGTGLVSPAEGDLLRYDATDQRFENGKTLTGDYTVVGTLTATALVADDLTLTDDLVVAGDASITGLATVGLTLGVAGATTLDTTLAVGGAATLSSTLALAGTLSGAGFSFTSGSMTTLTVSGVLTAGTLSPTTLAVSGNASVGGSLQVTGAASFVDDVTVNANLSAGAIAGTSLSTGGLISGAGSLDIAKIGWSAAGNDVTALLTSAAGTYTVSGIQTDLTVQTMLTLNPDAHHILGGVDGFIVPVGTTAQEPTGAAGMIRYDSDAGAFMGYTSSWAALGGGSTVITDQTGTAYRSLLVDSAGDVIELAHGTSGHVLTSNGASADPTWQAAGGGSSLTYVQDDTDHGELLYSTFIAMESDSLGIVINGVDTDVQPRINFLDDDGGTQVGNIRATSTGFVVDNRRTSSPIILRSKNSSAAVVNNFHGDPDGQTTLYTDGLEVLHTDTQNIGIHTNGTLTDPWLGFYHDAGEGARQGFLQCGQTATTMRWQSEVHGAIVHINGEDTGGTVRSMFTGDPDAGTSLSYTGTVAVETVAKGILVTDTSGDIPLITLQQDGGTDTCIIGHIANNSSIGIDSLVNGSVFAFRGKDAGGTLRNLIVARPDTSIDMYYNGALSFKVISGTIQTGTHTGIGAETITGYITITDLGGTSRKIAVVS